VAPRFEEENRACSPQENTLGSFFSSPFEKDPFFFGTAPRIVFSPPPPLRRGCTLPRDVLPFKGLFFPPTPRDKKLSLYFFSVSPPWPGSFRLAGQGHRFFFHKRTPGLFSPAKPRPDRVPLCHPLFLVPSSPLAPFFSPYSPPQTSSFLQAAWFHPQTDRGLPSSTPTNDSSAQGEDLPPNETMRRAPFPSEKALLFSLHTRFILLLFCTG